MHAKVESAGARCCCASRPSLCFTATALEMRHIPKHATKKKSHQPRQQKGSIPCCVPQVFYIFPPGGLVRDKRENREPPGDHGPRLARLTVRPCSLARIVVLTFSRVLWAYMHRQVPQRFRRLPWDHSHFPREERLESFRYR